MNNKRIAFVVAVNEAVVDWSVGKDLNMSDQGGTGTVKPGDWCHDEEWTVEQSCGRAVLDDAVFNTKSLTVWCKICSLCNFHLKVGFAGSRQIADK